VTLPTNRSIPSATVIPVLAYADAREAAQWLCRSFGFAERLRIGNHRVQDAHPRDWGGEVVGAP
jgi:uncharacterized glyoxalase superfamily protein PhnB